MTDSTTETNRFSNRLIAEASPYLRQHAENPVEWYPWGEEALAKAKAEDKPILLSIGYSACHWCHVMAHECFENVEIAGLMNQDFINVKVDREERPDLDDIYQKSAQVFLGRGGAPLVRGPGIGSLYLDNQGTQGFLYNPGNNFQSFSFRNPTTGQAWSGAVNTLGPQLSIGLIQGANQVGSPLVLPGPPWQTAPLPRIQSTLLDEIS